MSVPPSSPPKPFVYAVAFRVAGARREMIVTVRASADHDAYVQAFRVLTLGFAIVPEEMIGCRVVIDAATPEPPTV